MPDHPDRAGPAPDFFATYRGTLIACTLVGLATAHHYAAVLLIFLVLPFLIWFLYSIVIVATRPQRRKVQLTRVALWLATFFLIGMVQYAWFHAARSEGDRIVRALEKHRQTHGTYPPDLRALGEDSNKLKDEARLRYGVTEGKPTVVYGSPFTPFDQYAYDFEKKSWTLIRD
jgi:hypothetical protein